MSRTEIIREVADLYNPDPDATVEVTITVGYDIARPDPSVGIFRSYLDDWWVECTDSDLCDEAQAEAWLMGDGARELEDIPDAAEDDDYWDAADHAYREWRDSV